jgi:uncharacterized protein (TIGR02757 family)
VTARRLRARLDVLVSRYGRLLDHDPLSLVRPYEDPRDREVAGLVASGLAFGGVGQVLRSAGAVLALLGHRPARAIRDGAVARKLTRFRHRWVAGEDVALQLAVADRMIREAGSVEAFFLEGFDPRAPDPGVALTSFSRRAKLLAGSTGAARRGFRYLFPEPGTGGAAKRLCLFLRWMARPDDGLDLGNWSGVPARSLVIPLDTHVLRISRYIGLTERRTASWATALEVTASLRRLCPEDPTRYDFALAQLGIRRGCLHRWVPEVCVDCPLEEVCVLASRTS